MPGRSFLALAIALCWSSQAHAANPGALEISGGLDLVSDYRFRGISQTGLDPAAQASLTITHKSGAYVSAWSSNIRRTEGGARGEVDLTAGYGWKAGAAALDLAVTYYTYPGDRSLNYAEISAVMTYDAGPFQPHIALSFVPPQSATRRDIGGRAANVYLATGADIEIPHTPVTISAEIGYERGFFDCSNSGGKIDWQLGATVHLAGIDFRLSYVDSSVHVREGGKDLGRAGAVAQISLAF